MKAAALAIGALLLALVAAVPSGARQQDGFQACGNLPVLTTWQIRAKHVKCDSARSVVRRYVEANIDEGDTKTRQVGDFRCKITGYYYDGAYMRCAADGGYRDIRFTRGG